MKITDPEINKIIADKATAYLKKRMMMNQKIIKLRFSEEKLIKFDDFMKKYNILKDKIRKIEDFKDLRRKELINDANTYIDLFADSIVLTEEQIDNLMFWVRKSIETYGLNEYTRNSSETSFIRWALMELKNNTLNTLTNEEKEKLNNWKHYIRLTQNVGFCNEISCKFNNDDNYAFSIQTPEKILCQINENGNLIVDESLEHEDLIILPNIYINYTQEHDRNRFSIFVEKLIDGKKFMEDISYTRTLYSENYFQFESYQKPNHLYPLDKFLDGDLEFLKQLSYNKISLEKTLRAIITYENLSDEEKKQMKIITEIASDWWANKVCNPTFDSELEFMPMRLVFMAHSKKTIPEEENINHFKTNLANTIIKNLLYNPNDFYLEVDYGPDEDLYQAAKDAQLDVDFPWKTKMYISIEEVSVKEGYGAEEKVLYSVKEQQDIDDRKVPKKKF